MIDRVNSALKNIDIFQQSLLLYARKKKSFGTTIGGLISFIFLFLLFFITIYSINKVFSYSARSISSFTKINEFADPIPLTNDNFMLSFAILLSNGTNQMMMNNSYAYFKFEVKKVTCDLGSCSYQNLSLISCTDLNLPSFWNPIDFKSMTCLSDININLLGSNLGIDSSDSLESFQLVVSQCDTDTTIFKCANESQVQNILQDWNAQVFIYFTNNIIDPQEFVTGSSQYLDYLGLYLIPGMNMNYNLFADFIEIDKYEGYFWPQLSNFSSFVFENEGQITYSPQWIKSNSNTYLTLNIKKSPNTRTYILTQNDIYYVFTTMGGFGISIYFIFYWITAKYSKFTSEIEISNHLFSFQTKNENKTAVNKGNNSKEMSLISNCSEISENDMNSQAIKKNIGKYFYKNLYRSQELFNNLDFNFCNFLNHSASKSLKSHEKNEVEKLIDFAQQNIQEDLDIVKIIKKLKELERLKKLILSEDQLECFNFISNEKESINLLDEKIHINLASDNKEYYDIVKEGSILLEEKVKPNSLEDYWRKFLNYKKLEGNKSDVLNSKILQQIDPDLIIIFQDIKSNMGETISKESFSRYIGECVKEYKPKLT